jgi:excisionase family DNA binding protein
MTTDLNHGPIGLEVDEQILTPGEVAELFKVHPKTVTRWAASGRLPSFQTPGGHNRFRESDIKKILLG